MNRLRDMGKGQASLMAVVVTAAATVVGSIFTAWVTAGAAANDRISELKTEVVQVTERENNHYGEVQRQLTEINGKLDDALGLKSRQATQR